MPGRKGAASAYAPDPVAREQLILQNLPLVHHVIGRLAIGMPHVVDREDLVAHGVIGLIQAIDRYDPSHGVPFGPWATIRIRGAVIDAIRALDLVNPATRQRVRALQSATHELTSTLGRFPTDGELQQALSISANEYASILEAASCQIVSLDAPADDDGSPLADLLEGAAEDPSERGVILATVAEALKRLDERERLVLTLYYVEDLTLQEVAAVIGVHKTVVVRLHSRAILKLRALLDAEPRSTTHPEEDAHVPPIPGTPQKPPHDPLPGRDSSDRPDDPADPAVAAGAGPRAGGRYAGARRAYLSGRRIQLGPASG